MSMTNWAELEVAAACKRENPGWNGESFDYGCSCYQSALKAYKSIMEDNHSGYSYSVTKNILIKLLNNIPLSPITDDDFFTVERGTEEYPGESDEWLSSRGLKSDLQCPRRSSLFRKEHLDGTVTYRDIDRSYCINAENPSDTFSSGVDKFLDTLYPITMPYVPKENMFKVYVKSWLTDKKHGDFDVHVITGYTDQDGIWHDYDHWEYYGDNGTEIITDPERKKELEELRVYSLETDIASRLVRDIIDMFIPEHSWGTPEYSRINNICNSIIDPLTDELVKKCNVLTITDDHGICFLNTWGNLHVITEGIPEDQQELVSEYPEINDLINFVGTIKKNIAEKLK